MPFTRSRVEGDCNLVELGIIDCSNPPLTEAQWPLRRRNGDPPWGREATITIGPAFAPPSLEVPVVEQPDLLIELTISLHMGVLIVKQSSTYTDDDQSTWESRPD